MILNFTKNTIGRDFVCGDLHGSYTLLIDSLSKIGFNKDYDRLFCTGDLVDRGKENTECIFLLDEPWFFSVMGNHDRMLIEYYYSRKLSNADNYKQWHKSNGGGWAHYISSSMLDILIVRIEALPLAIKVDTDAGYVGIIHADCPFKDWVKFEDWLLTYITYTDLERIENIALWNRDNIRNKYTFNIENIYKVYHGHTVLPSPKTLGNRKYIDTGAVFTNNLTIEQIQ